MTSHTPPTAASASTAGCCHWLAPSTAQGPPIPCQDLIHSLTSQQLGTTTNAIAARRPVTGGRSQDQVARPTAVHRTPMTMATSSKPGPRLGASQYIAASR